MSAELEGLATNALEEYLDNVRFRVSTGIVSSRNILAVLRKAAVEQTTGVSEDWRSWAYY